MGSSAKYILPLVAIAGIGIATGGFGLAAGAGAAAGSGAAAGTTAAAGFTSVGAIGAAPAAATAASAGISSNALMALGAGVSALGTGAQFMAQQEQIALAEAEQKLQVAEAKRDTEERLSRTLAANAVMFGALGITPGSGSAASVQSAAVKSADRESASINASDGLSRTRIRSARRGNVVGSLLKIGSLGIGAARGAF